MNSSQLNNSAVYILEWHLQRNLNEISLNPVKGWKESNNFLIALINIWRRLNEWGKIHGQISQGVVFQLVQGVVFSVYIDQLSFGPSSEVTTEKIQLFTVLLTQCLFIPLPYSPTLFHFRLDLLQNELMFLEQVLFVLRQVYTRGFIVIPAYQHPYIQEIERYIALCRQPQPASFQSMQFMVPITTSLPSHSAPTSPTTLSYIFSTPSPPPTIAIPTPILTTPPLNSSNKDKTTFQQLNMNSFPMESQSTTTDTSPIPGTRSLLPTLRHSAHSFHGGSSSSSSTVPKLVLIPAAEAEVVAESVTEVKTEVVVAESPPSPPSSHSTAAANHPSVRQLLAILRKEAKDLLLPQEHQDYLLVCIYTAFQAMSPHTCSHEQLIRLVMTIKDSPLFAQVTSLSPWMIQGITKTKIRGVLGILKQGELVTKSGSMMSGDDTAVQLHLCKEIVSLEILRDRHDHFLISYVHENGMVIPEEIQGEILWTTMEREKKQQRIAWLQYCMDQLMVVAIAEMKTMFKQ